MAFSDINNFSPQINFTGDPLVNNVLYFYDVNGQFYKTNSISNITWIFGDGSTSSSNIPTQIYSHSYPLSKLYNISISLTDTSGNTATSNISLPILENDLIVEKDDLITLSGPSFPPRYGENKLINLSNFLPDNLRGTDTQTFLEIFENFLNTMFTGFDGYTISNTNIPITKSVTSGTNIPYQNTYSYSLPDSVSANTIATDVENLTINWPSNIYDQNQTISVLEKIKRLTELQDIELIDSEYISYFAKNLGYNVNVSRNEIPGNLFGNLSTIQSDTGISTSATDSDRYLRFVIEQLPSWYKIKSTNNAIKVMLFSFGLIADLINFYTSDYDEKNSSHWIADFNGDFSQIKDSNFPTPHFGVAISIDKSENLSFDFSQMNTITAAIESIQPIQSIFHGLTGYLERSFPLIYTFGLNRFSRYIKIGTTSANPSDYFRNHNSSGVSGNLYGR